MECQSYYYFYILYIVHVLQTISNINFSYLIQEVKVGGKLNISFLRLYSYNTSSSF